MALEFKGLFPISLNLSPDLSKTYDTDKLKRELFELLTSLENKGYVIDTHDGLGKTNKGLALRVIKTMIAQSKQHPHLFIGYTGGIKNGRFVCDGVGMEVGCWDSDAPDRMAMQLGGTVLEAHKMSYATKLIKESNPIDDADDTQVQIAKIKKEIGL